jgi:hypothetical protein
MNFSFLRSRILENDAPYYICQLRPGLRNNDGNTYLKIGEHRSDRPPLTPYNDNCTIAVNCHRQQSSFSIQGIKIYATK